MKKTILILLLVSVSCTNSNRLMKEETRIKDFLLNQKKDSFILVLDTISSFKWDELLIAGPYNDLNEVTGYNFEEIPNTTKSHDRFILFCFIEKKKGIKYMEFRRYLFFDKIFEGKYLNKKKSKKESNFLITKNN
ncbi:hypothetical protein [uncultured Polaribacter sp.]|uniref:hypothetical protein n=1 Tax=uncultured Polaribacter sp. TaxID=174711 RepID=UPI00259B38AE|nr:hypothetical protein [uncultured Polaribacter sp.]